MKSTALRFVRSPTADRVWYKGDLAKQAQKLREARSKENYEKTATNETLKKLKDAAAMEKMKRTMSFDGMTGKTDIKNLPYNAVAVRDAAEAVLHRMGDAI